MKGSCGLAVLVAAALPLAAIADNPREDLPRAGGGATLDRPISPLSGAQIIAATSSSNASVKTSKATTYTQEAGLGVFQAWSLTASAPLNKASDTTDITSIDGLVNAASLELKFTDFRVHGIKRPYANIQKVDEICNRVLAEMKRQTGKGREPGSGCDMAEVRKYSPADTKAFDDAFWDYSDRNAWMWGANAKLGYQNYSFVDASTASKGKQDETPWSLGGFIGWNPDTERTIFTAGFQYQHSFKEGDSGTVCPASAGTAVTCSTGAIGSPKKVTKKIGTLEVRKAFAWGGMGAKFDRDFEGRVWGVELPIHFIRDKDGKFTGGVKWAWRSDTHVSAIGVFVGTTFGLFD